MSSASSRGIGRYAFEIVTGLAVLGLILTPPFASAATGLVALLIAGPLLIFIRPSGSGLGRDGVVALAAMTVLGASGLLFSMLAVNPLISFIGKQGQHTGSAMWLAAAAVLAATLLTQRKGDVGRVSRSIAVAGAIFAFSALLDFAGLFEAFRFSPEPAGIMESSVSLGQTLVIALGCAVGWALTARSQAQRILALAVLAAIAAGLFVADARSAIVAVVLGAAIAGGGAALGKLKDGLVPYLGWGLVGLTLVGVGIAFVFFAPGADSRAGELTELTNDRSVIWSSAIAQVSESPILGKGPEQFSAWVTWDSEPGVSLSKTGTYDPHNIALYWLVAGGVVGLMIAGAVAGLLLGLLWKIAASREYAFGVLALLAGLIGWGVAVMFGWVSTVALLFAALLAGSLIGASDLAAGKQTYASKATNLLAGLFVMLVAVITLVFWWNPMFAEYQWAASVEELGMDPESMVEIAERSADPGAAASAVGQLVSMGTASPSVASAPLQVAESLEPILEHNAVWHVDAAFEGSQLASVRIGMLDQGEWDDVAAYLDAGKQADPASGLWDYAGAVTASQLDENDAARERAEAALEYPLPDAVRVWCEEVASGATP